VELADRVDLAAVGLPGADHLAAPRPAGAVPRHRVHGGKWVCDQEWPRLDEHTRQRVRRGVPVEEVIQYNGQPTTDHCWSLVRSRRSRAVGDSPSVRRPGHDPLAVIYSLVTRVAADRPL
jgi:hypothetical protein